MIDIALILKLYKYPQRKIEEDIRHRYLVSVKIYSRIDREMIRVCTTRSLDSVNKLVQIHRHPFDNLFYTMKSILLDHLTSILNDEVNQLINENEEILHLISSLNIHYFHRHHKLVLLKVPALA